MANLSNINNKFLVTTGGNILIGGTAAVGSSILQVTGNASFAGNVTLDNILLTTATLPAQNTPSISLRSSNNEIYFQAGSANVFNFMKADYTTMLALDGTTSATFAGTVIGTTARFDTLNDSANSKNLIYRNSSSTNTVVGGGSSPDKIYIQDNGNVGIGTSSITNYGLNYKNLDVSGSNGAYITLIGTTNTVKVDIAAETAAGYVGTKTAHPFIFRTDDVARMRIDSSGNVKLTDEKILGLRTSTNDYALQYRDLDFRLIGSTDGTTQRKFSFGYYTSDNPAGTWNGKTYINSYTGQTVIGNTSLPADHMLQISNPGQAYARFALTNSQTGNASGDGLKFQMENLNSIIKNQENGSLAFGTNGRETDLYINSSGTGGASYVGISNTSGVGARTKLGVSFNVGGSAASLAESVTYATMEMYPYRTGSTYGMFFGNKGTAAGYIQTANGAGNDKGDIHINPFGGSVGIGVGNASAGALLDVVAPNSGGAARQDMFRLLQSGQNTFSCYMYGGTTDLVQLHVSGAEQHLSLTTGGVATATTATGIHLRSGGNVGIATLDPQAKLQVNQSGASLIGAIIKATDSGYYNQVLQISCARGATSGYNLIQALNSTSTECFKVAGTGNVSNTNNSYGAISDARLKENIVDATPKLNDLMKVKIRNFNLIGDDNKQIGVIAQEIEKVFPSLVENTKEKNSEEITKSVKYSVFVPMLVKAIQELKADNDSLKARIETLENN